VDRYGELELQSLVGLVKITDGASATASRVAPVFGVPLEESLHVAVVLVGSVGSLIEEIEYRRDRWDLSYFVIPVETMDDFAPVVASLAGH
jgi:hypothetical protein